MNKKIKFFSLLLILFSIITSTFSIFYYADILIDVDNSGFTTINGNSNYKGFLNITNNPSFTSKKANIWTLEINSKKDEIFENFIFELILPDNAQISYIKTTPKFRIENINNRIKIIGTGENKPFTLIVQYKLNEKTNVALLFKDNIIKIMSFILILLILLILFIGYKFIGREKQIKKHFEEIFSNSNKILEKQIKKENKNTKKIKNQKKKLNFDISILSQRQQDIIKVLERKGKITQKQLLEELKIPKSSISRNIRSLELKTIIIKESNGLSNYISINYNYGFEID